MHTVYFVLFLLSAILFAASAVTSSVRPVNLQAAGLFCFALVFVLQSAQRM